MRSEITQEEFDTLVAEVRESFRRMRERPHPLPEPTAAALERELRRVRRQREVLRSTVKQVISVLDIAARLLPEELDFEGMISDLQRVYDATSE